MKNERVDVMFIGGPAAGKIDSVPAGAKVWYERVIQPDMFSHEREQSSAQNLRTDELNFQYVRFTAEIENGELHYFRPADWTEEQVVRELVQAYCRGAEKAKEASR